MLQELCQYSYLTFFAHNPLDLDKSAAKRTSKFPSQTKTGAHMMWTPAQYRDDMSVTLYT